MCVVPLLAATACTDDDGVSVQEPGPAASVRFINAVPDTGTVDLRFVDRVENLPTLLGVPFQGWSGFYQRVEPGDRVARVFPNSSDVELTKIRLVDTVLALEEGTRYTLVYAGRASATAPETERHRLEVIVDPPTPPTPGADEIALQVLNVAVGMGAVDVYVVRVDSAAVPTPADFATNNAAKLSNIGFLEKAVDYVNAPALSSGLYRFVVTATGSTTPIFEATPNQPGAAAPPGATYGPQPGVRIAGSVLTAVVVGGSTPGTRQSTAENQNPTVFLMADKVLNP